MPQTAHEAHTLNLLERGRPLTDGEIGCYLADRQTAIRHATADIGTEIAAQLWERAEARAASQPQEDAVGDRWYLGSMNDGLFITNTPPRPSTDDAWHDRPDGPSLVLRAGASIEDAQAIVDAHNASLTRAQPDGLERDGERCNNCGKGYATVYRVPDEVWAQLHDRAPGGLLCLTCADRLAIDKGIDLWWEASLGGWHRPDESSAVLPEPTWPSLDQGTLRERLTTAMEQHRYASGRVGWPIDPPQFASLDEYQSWHRACVRWYREMLDQLDVIEARE